LTKAELRDQIDAHYIEPVTVIATRGELTDRELAALEAEAETCAKRIGTNAERWGRGGLDFADRRAVEMWRRVSEAQEKEANE
jgi:hypothetical protein